MFQYPPGERQFADYLRFPFATFTEPSVLSPDLLRSIWGSTYISVWFDGHRHFLPTRDDAVNRAGTVILLLMVVIPQFRPLFEDAGEALPLATQILVGLGEVFQHYWWAIGLAVVGLVLLARRELSNPVRRFRWDGVFLRIPLVGDLVSKIEVASVIRKVVGKPR